MRLDQPLATAVEGVERAMIGHALEQANGAVETAAKILGRSRKGLYLKRQKYQIGHFSDANGFEADIGD